MPELQQKVEELERKIKELETLAQLSPQYKQTIERLVGNTSQYLPTDYDKIVNEAGVTSYAIPDAFDGLSLINGKLYGYYNP